MTTTRVFVRGYCQRAAGGTEDGPLRFVAATEGVKADGLDLRMDGAELERFKANPVIMYAHEYFGRDALPIGRASDVFVDGTRLIEDIEFDLEDPFAAAVDRKYRAGFMNAVSVGFDIHEVDFDTPDGSVIAKRWELIETSAVPIPLDPNAIKEDARGLIRSGGLAAVERRLAGIEATLAELTRTGPPPTGGGGDRLVAARRRLRLSGHSLTN